MIDADRAVISIGPLPSPNHQDLYSQLLTVYLDTRYLHDAPYELEIAGRLAHNLKNELVAYSICTNRATTSLTERLAFRLQASKHKDNAQGLIASLAGGVAGSLELTASEIVPATFIRSFIMDMRVVTTNQSQNN